jgi:hypothetical protein
MSLPLILESVNMATTKNFCQRVDIFLSPATGNILLLVTIITSCNSSWDCKVVLLTKHPQAKPSKLNKIQHQFYRGAWYKQCSTPHQYATLVSRKISKHNISYQNISKHIRSIVLHNWSNIICLLFTFGHTIN